MPSCSSFFRVAAFAAAALWTEDGSAETVTINVPATANPYLAGLPLGATARVGDSAPQQSPVLVRRMLSHAIGVTFTAEGAIQHTPECPPDCHGPNGAEPARHMDGAENGISDIAAPMNALVGVFVNDNRPDTSDAPRPLHAKSPKRGVQTLSPQLKQVFFIGDGKTDKGAYRRYLVPAGATRLYLGVMDGYEWNNNSGSFTVTVAIERDQVDSELYQVESTITYSKWACLPDRKYCTPDHPTAEEILPGRFHVTMPASSEWSISVPDPEGRAVIHGAKGMVCFAPDSCVGPGGNSGAAGPGFLDENKPAGALISRVIGGRLYFSANHRKGAPFHLHEGYFEFEVRTR